MDSGKKVAVAVLVTVIVGVWAVMFLSGRFGGRLSVEEAERDCVMSLKVYYNAQHVFHRKDRDGDGALEFAADLDKLYAPSADGGEEGKHLVNKALAEADDDGDALPGLRSRIPRKGYLYHDLKGNVAGGKARYFKPDGGNGDGFSDGFGLLGYPAEYGKTGKRKFVIGPDGAIYAKDEGDGQVFDFFPDVAADGWERVR